MRPPRHDVRKVGGIVFEQFVVMGDNQQAHLFAADFGNALARQTHRVGIEAAVGLVENGELGLQHGQLQESRRASSRRPRNRR